MSITKEKVIGIFYFDRLFFITKKYQSNLSIGLILNLSMLTFESSCFKSWIENKNIRQFNRFFINTTIISTC